MKEAPIAARPDANARSKFPLWLQWTLATIVGYALGMSVSTSVVGSLIRPLGPVLDGMLNVLIYGAVIGLLIGLAEFAVLAHRGVSISAWLIATSLGGAVAFAAAALAGEALGSLIDPGRTNVAGEAAVALVAGALIGLALGLAQWLVLRIRLPRTGWWFVASIGGTVIGSLIAATLLGLFEISLLSTVPATTVGVIAGLSTGFLQGLVLSSNAKLVFRAEK